MRLKKLETSLHENARDIFIHNGINKSAYRASEQSRSRRDEARSEAYFQHTPQRRARSNAGMRSYDALYRNAKLFAGQIVNIAAHIYRDISQNISQNISVSNGLAPVLLTIITILSLHTYILISPANKPLQTASLLMPASEIEPEQNDAKDTEPRNEKMLSKPANPPPVGYSKRRY
ncbi:MAG: hypothetical protein HZB79_05390 [Deltaproteobacteria bacterium]|nr:hypothetical protein [Deltaproteobacteria bacterium]